MSSSFSLTSAVSSGDENAVSASLANGADVNERTSGGQTALILAVVRGHTHLVRLLVEAGADPKQRDNLGLNAIDWAQRRGLSEALEILSNAPVSSTPPTRIQIDFDEREREAPQPPREAPAREVVSDAEKSRQWVAGLKQRLDEQASRRSPRAEPPPQPPPPVVPEPPPPVIPEPPPSVHSSRILLTTPPAVEATGKRKRCPQCGEIYNGDLVSYCAHHIVPLVDVDAPAISEPPPPTKSNPPLFWIMVIVTLAGSIIVGSLITTYLYKSNQASARTAAEQPKMVKGLPELGGDVVGKETLLPEAECPQRGSEPVSGTVTVHIMVDKNGQVYKARGVGGDWLMRGAATEAAMKATFSPEKLGHREADGTITYTFKP